jgi:uncharacterized protein YggE
MLSTLLILSLSATPVSPRTITLVGDARLTFKPNQVLATFLLQASHRDQAGAKKLGEEKLAKLVRACREAGVDPRNITISDGGVIPEYRGNEVVGHVLNRNVQLTLTDMAKIDEALTAAVRNGGVLTGGVFIQNTEHQLYETRVRIAAAQAARERAKGMLEALGAKAGLPSSVSDRTQPVESISVGTFSVPAEGPVVTSFASRELTVISQVTVVYDIVAP